MTFNMNRIWQVLTLFVCLAIPALPQTKDFDIDLANRNFRVLLGQRLNNFPKPEYVKNIRQAFAASNPEFNIKFIDVAEYENAYKNNGTITEPFVVGNEIFIIAREPVKSKITAALDRGHPEHEEMLRSVDLGLLAADLIFGNTTIAQRSDILFRLAQISKMVDGVEKDKNVTAIFKKYLPPLKTIRLFVELKLRHKELYPEESISQSLGYIMGKNIADMITGFIASNMFDR